MSRFESVPVADQPEPRPGAVATPLTPAEILERLDTASRRGRLPGFMRGGCGGVFSVETHGHPFEGDLIARAVPDAPGGGRLEFDWRMRRRLPLVFAATLIATVWPGVYFVDHLIPGEWGVISSTVYWWYLPLSILPLPWVWRTLMKRSRRSNEEAAALAIRKIAAEIGGTVVPPSQAMPR